MLHTVLLITKIQKQEKHASTFFSVSYTSIINSTRTTSSAYLKESFNYLHDTVVGEAAAENTHAFF